MLNSHRFGPVALAPTGSTPETELEFYAENYMGSASFNPTVGPPMTAAGSTQWAERPTELGRWIVDVNDTPNDGLYCSSAVTSVKKNLAIFTVYAAPGGSIFTAGNLMDFRDSGNYRLIIPAQITAGTGRNGNGWYYGQSSGLDATSVISGEDTRQFYIRCMLFEDNVGRMFIGGGSVDKTGSFEDTSLDLTMRFGFTSGGTLDIEIATLQVYSLPLGETFTAEFLDGIGEAIESYYSGATSPEAVWSAITV